MLEFLLLYSCLENIACPQTFGNYKYYNKAIVQDVEANINGVYTQLPVIIREYTLPAAAVALNGTYNVSLSTELSASFSRSGTSLTLTIPLN